MDQKRIEDVKISVAFRFHVNLYHSYRADTPDEDGIGKDIRLIKYILDILDHYNAKGVPVKGTWDFDNYFSLEVNMRKHCPELIDRIKERVSKGYDEIEIMSYNNGLVSAHTEEEFLENIKLSISNEGQSGVKDIFGKFAPVVRPQECMMTPGLIKLYILAGIKAISVFYSCVPFNGFSNFVPLLPTEKRYNPLWYTAPGFNEKIAVLPAINPGDLYDQFGITRLVKKLRKEQEKMEHPCDLLVLVDMDADDDFWQGYFNTTVSFGLGLKKPLVDGGLHYFIKQLSKLPYVKFDTPYEYLQSHPPVGEVSVGQDLADGSFDSYSPWSDKLENSKLWAGVDRTRAVSEYALSVSGYCEQISQKITESIQQRLRTTSTTHFGLSTPVMCKPRLKQAIERVKGTIENSEQILKMALKQTPQQKNAIKAVIPKRYYRGDGRKQGLIRLINSNGPGLTGEGVHFAFTREVFGKTETVLLYSGHEFEISLTKGETDTSATVYGEENAIGNAAVRLSRNAENELELRYNGRAATDKGSFITSIHYDNKIIKASDIKYTISTIEGKAASITETGKVVIDQDGDKAAIYEKKYQIIGDLPYLYVDVDIHYPETSDFGTNKTKVRRLHRGYDTRWREVAPLEIVPAFRGTAKHPIRVYKHDFLGEISYFDYNYGTFSENHEFDAGNNAITCGFVSFVTNNEGLLIAQSVAADNNFAFSRVRLRKDNGNDKLIINPFGVYSGKQLNYVTENVGLAKKVALKFAESYMSCAPTFRGGRQQFSLMIAPFDGEKPDDPLINDAMMHAYPPYIQSTNDQVKMIDFTDWDNFEPLD